MNKKRVYILIEPQPSADIVYELSRSYALQKKDANYKRRVTWLGQNAKDRIFQASEYEKQRQKHGISCQYKLFEEENRYIFGSKWLGYLIVANNSENKYK